MSEENGLNLQQVQFIQEYFVDFNATQAYLRVYPDSSDEGARRSASRLLTNVDIQIEIQRLMDARALSCEIRQDWILKNLKEGIERCMQHAPVLNKKGVQIFIETQNGKLAAAYTFQPAGMFKGLELAGKNIGMFKEKHEHNHSGAIPHNGGTSRATEILEGFIKSREKDQ